MAHRAKQEIMRVEKEKTVKEKVNTFDPEAFKKDLVTRQLET